MQFKTEEDLRKNLTKRVSRDITARLWAFNGVKFTASKGYFDGDFYTRVEYTCDLRQLTARLERGYEFNGTLNIIAEQTFDSDNAISECIDWVVNKLMEVYKTLLDRTAPYLFKKDLYEQAVNRPIRL